jgi:uncharacterized oxidoreductase
MKTSGNTVLITGGATGIGFALAQEFLDAGSEVVVCGRRAEKLFEAKQKRPRLHTISCDLSKKDGREELFEWAENNFGEINVLVNNAGIQRIIDFKKGAPELFDGEDEVAINLTAPIELSAYFVPVLSKRNEAAIINVSSGLGFVPLALFPVYCATKAAIHSFSLSLRHQLRNTPIKVFEIIAPTTDTELDKGSRAKRGAPRGVAVDEVAKAAMKALSNDEFECAIGEASGLRAASRSNPEEAFNRMNSRVEI